MLVRLVSTGRIVESRHLALGSRFPSLGRTDRLHLALRF